MTEKDVKNTEAENQDAEVTASEDNLESTNQEATAEQTEDTSSESTSQESETPAEDTPAETSSEEEAGEETSAPDPSILKEAADEVAAEDDGSFNWDVKTKSYSPYSEAKRKELEELYDKTFNDVSENEIVNGKVVAITKQEVVLDIGFKSDGLVPISEFKDELENMKAGSEVEVYVVEKENIKGQLVLSRKNAKLMRAWEKITDAYENDKIVTGLIVSKTKGGLIVNISGLETFLPGSQIDVKPIVDYDAYVGKSMDFKVVKINEAIKNAVVSHKALIESDLEAQRQEIISKLEKGQVLEGIIKNITDFGAFIDLGGVDGLLYITDISWGRINHPSEVLELNQKINVVVLDFDDDKRRISLGLKQLQPHPWDTLDESIQVSSKIKGKIVNIEDYGAFLEIIPGVEGLIHISEVTWSNQPVNAKEFFNLGEEYEAIVMTIDREDRKMSLSVKQLTKDPWSDIEEKYPEASQHTGQVKNITPYGVFVELEEGVGGMVHISDLSWTKRFGHPSEFTKVGEELEVVILNIDKENRKLSLGHKQIEEDPWDTFESVFPVNSVHEATLIKRDDKGGIVLLPYGLEAYSPIKHLKKEDGSLAEADEKLPFRVLDFDRGEKRIIVSHSRHLDEIKKSEAEDAKRSAEAETQQTRSNVKKTNRQTEKSTLGDLGVLSQLKEQMVESEKQALTERMEKKEAEAKAKKEKEAEDTDEEKPAAKKKSTSKKKEESEEDKDDATEETKAKSKKSTAKSKESDDDDAEETAESKEDKKDDDSKESDK